MIKVSDFNLRPTISAMVQEILVDVVTYLLGGWVQNRLEDVGCAW